jgi:hypothetical protein
MNEDTSVQGKVLPNCVTSEAFTAAEINEVLSTVTDD